MTRSTAAAIAALTVFWFSATAPAADEAWIDARCSKLPFEKLGPFVHLSDGSILCLQGNTTSVTADVRQPAVAGSFYPGDRQELAREVAALLRTTFTELARAIEDVATDAHEEYVFKKYLQEKWEQIIARL